MFNDNDGGKRQRTIERLRQKNRNRVWSGMMVMRLARFALNILLFTE